MRTEYKKEVTISLSTLMSPLFMSAHIRAGAVSRTEDASGASGAAVGCPQSVESAVLWAFENAFGAAGAVLRAFEGASRTPGGCFWHRISLPYRSVLS